MGNRACTPRGLERARSTASGIVPDQDPLMRSSMGRISKGEIAKDFEMTTSVLGTGYSGAVKMAVHKATRQKCAVKQFSKRRLKPHRLELLQCEVQVYLVLDHPNICRLLYAYEGKNDVWLIMELCGCELYSRLCEKKVYREKDAADVMLQMLQAVNYCHSHNIVHRDLKLENWMYGATDADERLKLIDFGFSRIVAGNDETLEMPCGTLHYTPPEVLLRKYTNKCDMWSLGVICYMLLLGRPPFRGKNNPKIAKAIMHEDFPKDGRWRTLTANAQDFVTQLLTKDANVRPSAEQALEHAWLAALKAQVAFSISNPSMGAGFESSAGEDLGTEVLSNLRQFAGGSHLRRAALTMLAYSLTSRELQDLEIAFLAFDTSGRGTITLDQLSQVMREHCPAEVQPAEIERIFQSLDFDQNEEVAYTPFIAAMLATRVRQHEDKVKAAFESFDQQKNGFITADNLVQIFTTVPGAGGGGRGLTKEEAEEWIREVDFKGNGVIDYEGFVGALVGKKLWAMPSLDAEGDVQLPTVQVFEDGVRVRPRGQSDPDFSSRPKKTWADLRHGLVAAIIDGDMPEGEDDRRSQSFQGGATSYGGAKAQVNFRSVTCDVDDKYFS